MWHTARVRLSHSDQRATRGGKQKSVAVAWPLLPAGMDAIVNEADVVGLALKQLNVALKRWIENVALAKVGTDWERWCSTVRQELHTPVDKLDTPALLDIILCPDGWELL